MEFLENTSEHSLEFVEGIDTNQDPLSSLQLPYIPIPTIDNGARIQVENYDNGGQDLTYFDNDLFNHGSQYRLSEGVDIEKTSDIGGGFHVGWIEDGEWLEYTTNVKEGNYNIKARVASSNSNSAEMRVKLSDELLGTFEINSTGGFQNWQTLMLEDVMLVGGEEEVLRLEMVGGEFNINWIEFEEVADVIPESEEVFDVLPESVEKMVFPGDTWEERTPESQGVDSDKMQAALQVLEDFSGEDGVRETVIIRNGYLIFKGDNVENQHGVYSISKSITSTALGLLIDDLTVTLDTQASEVEPLLHGQYDDITLRHFATMTSGYEADGPNRWNEPSDDWSTTPFDVGAPMFEPGTAYAYWDEAMIMFGRLLTRLAEQDLYSFVDARIMEPIGIEEWSWWHEEQVEGHDLNYGATGVALNALELARFGHLFLNEGNWNGQQLISEDWVRQATRTQVPASLALADTDRSKTDGRGIYGFNWWTNGINAAGRRSMPEAPPGLYYASGLHNNMCFVIPEWNMLVVRMGEDGNPTEGKIPAYDRFFGRLSEAIMDI